MIKVSICIPAYEQPKNLYKCLKSISIQTFTDFEVIITDDSKSDNLINVIEQFKQQFIIRYIKNKRTKGSPENWNESIKYANGKYIKILHHDDSFKTINSLQNFVELLDYNPNAKVAFSSSYHIDNEGNHLSSHILSDKDKDNIKADSRYLLFGNVIGAPSIMIYHKSLNLIFDKRMKWLVDIDFYIRILKNNGFVYTREELIYINIGEEERITYICENNKNINIYEVMIMFEKFKLTRISYKYKYHFLKLFMKYNISSIEDIKKCGYRGNIISDISSLFKYVNFFLILYTILRKLKSVFR